VWVTEMANSHGRRGEARHGAAPRARHRLLSRHEVTMATDGRMDDDLLSRAVVSRYTDASWAYTTAFLHKTTYCTSPNPAC
jgi:hypothetical protein